MQPLNINMTKKELNQLSKDALEELGRTRGLELDKRLTKGKLVDQIAKLFKAEEKAPANGGGRSFKVSPKNSNA